jgi:hypothetical protein
MGLRDPHERHRARDGEVPVTMTRWAAIIALCLMAVPIALYTGVFPVAAVETWKWQSSAASAGGITPWPVLTKADVPSILMTIVGASIWWGVWYWLLRSHSGNLAGGVSVMPRSNLALGVLFVFLALAAGVLVTTRQSLF